MRALRTYSYWLAAFLFSMGVLNLCAQGVSNSKISAHLINAYTAGSSNIVAGHPKVLKILDVGSGMVNAMRAYKAGTPTGKVVLRVYSPHLYDLDSDPNASVAATNFWTTILQPSINSLSPSDRALLDYLEGPNEGQTPTLGYPGDRAIQASQWFNQFWTNLTPMIVAAGFKPCIGSIGVGNPGGSPSEMQSYLAAFVPALRQAKASGGAWSYHAYTINYTTDVNEEFYFSLRYRQFYSYFATAFPDLITMPLILTEGGVDAVGDPNTSGWQARGPAHYYERWLNWFDYQLAQDSYVMGCTLFQNGDPGGWSSFDLEPIAGWLRTYLTNPATVPPAPTGLSATPGNARITLTWTNAPVNPCSFKVKRSLINGGPYTSIATNLTIGVTNYSYVDTTVTNGGTYYYVVSAVNAVGEGPDSAQVTPPVIIPSNINCGGATVGPFIDDIYFSAGQTFAVTNTVDTNGLVNPAPMPVYQSQRYGNFTYSLPYLTPNAPYKVRLHFAEIYWDAAGQRLFHVLINGAQVLTNFDIWAAAGGIYKGNIQEFNAIASPGGVINVQFARVQDQASCNGIEIAINPTNVVPTAPTGLTTSVNTGKVSLAWTIPANATSFNVKRSTTSGSGYTIIATNITDSTFIDISFTPKTTYYYVISAQNAAGQSPNSAQASATPTNGLPDLVVTGISWTPNPAYAGNGVIFKATVKNQGSAATSNGIVIGVGFTVDGAGVSYSANTTTPLPPGNSVLLTANGGGSPGANWPATLGGHVVGALVDDVDRFPESNESNNFFTTNMSVYTSGYAINSGGSAVSFFLADQMSSGGTTSTSANVIDTSLGSTVAAPQAVYQSERRGTFNYLFNNLFPGRTYNVRLHFAELVYSNTNQRVFNVTINGTPALSNFDIISETGGQNKALIRRFNALADANGQINVQYTPTIDQAKSSGIEILTNTIPNAAPVLLAISNATVNAGSTLSFTARGVDPDQPLQTLSYSVAPGAPGGITINSSSGVFAWTPAVAQAPATNSITVQVTDNGSPALSATKTFSVIVVAPPRISQFTTSPTGELSLTFDSFPGKSYRIQYKTNLTDSSWLTLGSDIVAGSSSSSVPDNLNGNSHRFYRVVQLN